MNGFIAFLINERDALVKQCIERAIKICKEQEMPIEERRIRRKKRMPGENAKDVGLSAVQEIKRCMLEAMDRFRSEAEKRFSEMCLLNEVFGFLNPHTLLRRDSIESDMGKFENIIYASALQPFFRGIIGGGTGGPRRPWPPHFFFRRGPGGP